MDKTDLQRRERADEATSGLEVASTNNCNIYHDLIIIVIISRCHALVLLSPSPPQKTFLGPPPPPSSSAKGAPSENVSVFNLRPDSSVTNPGVRLA